MNKSINQAMFIDRGMHRSKAFKGLSKSTTEFLLELYSRRTLELEVTDLVIINNGQITFSYRDARRKFDSAPSTMERGISQLVQFGFIDIAHRVCIASV